MNQNNGIGFFEKYLSVWVALCIIVGIASGMSAAHGEKYYYPDDDDFKKLAGSLRDKYDIPSWFDLYYDPRVTKEEHWAMLLRHIKHLYETEATTNFDL